MFPPTDATSIRGVCPRGLIEARWAAASCSPGRSIRGVCPPRGLIEAGRTSARAACWPGGIRGVCPRGLIEARRHGRARRCAQARPIRGVCPRGLIEAWRYRARPPWQSPSAGSAPAASLKRAVHGAFRRRRYPSAGSAPAASLKRPASDGLADRVDRAIRGVCPRGLIEAARAPDGRPAGSPSSAGSAPAASLKRQTLRVDDLEGLVHPRGLPPAASLKRGAHEEVRRHDAPIRGVCPRGLIEATLSTWPTWSTAPAASLKRRFATEIRSS